MSGCSAIFEAIPLLLPCFGFACSVVFTNYSYVVFCLGRLGKRFVWQELYITFTNLRKVWEIKLLNTRDVYCLHHSVARALNQNYIVHTSENYSENKL